jgi:hypothetical protein
MRSKTVPSFLSLWGAALIAAFAAVPPFDQFDLRNVRGETSTYRGRRAIHLVPEPLTNNSQPLAIVTTPEFRDGLIEVDVAGSLAPGSSETARGFIGIAFRLQAGAASYELVSLRPTNARADDQLRRNHSTQYESLPDWPWDRLRRENPGVYDSYVDLVPGAWTKMKLVVSGFKAILFVNGSNQPCLVVNDLKLTQAKGAIALWVGPGTDGYFANLRVMPL